MIEMRWLTWDEEETVVPPLELVRFGGPPFPTRTVTRRRLQYRQMIDVTMYAGLGPWPDSAKNMQWSEWRDVPEVVERDPSCP